MDFAVYSQGCPGRTEMYHELCVQTRVGMSRARGFWPLT